MLIQRDTRHNTPRNTRKYFSLLFPPLSASDPETLPLTIITTPSTIAITSSLHFFSFRTPFLDSKTIGDSLVIRSTIHSMIRVQQHDRPYDTHTVRYTAQYTAQYS